MSATENTVTFIHTSDLQLGMRRKFLGAEAQARFEDSRLRAVERMGELATERGAEFIVMAGDIFDSNLLESRTVTRALEAIAALPVPVYMLPGNHDPLTEGALLTRAGELDNVTVLDTFEPVEHRPGVEIVGAPLLARHSVDDLPARALATLEPTGGIRILVGHGQYAKRSVDAEGDHFDLAVIEAALERGVIDYAAFGDTHSTQPIGTSGKVWFSGAPETTDFHDRREHVEGNETDSGNALVVEVAKRAGSRVDVDKQRVGEWTFDALHWDVGGGGDVDRVLADLKAYPDKARTVIKYSLEGTLGLADSQRLERGIAELEPTFGNLYERTRLMNLHLEPSDEEMAELPLSGYAREAMEELVDAAAGGEGSATARDAVNLLFRMAKEG